MSYRVMGLNAGKKKNDLCRRCGECCRSKSYYPDLNIWTVLDTYCPHFEWVAQDGKNIGNCRMYKDRNNGMPVTQNLKCIDAEYMVEARLQPPSCPYTKKVKNYDCKVINF